MTGKERRSGNSRGDQMVYLLATNHPILLNSYTSFQSFSRTLYIYIQKGVSPAYKRPGS